MTKSLKNHFKKDNLRFLSAYEALQDMGIILRPLCWTKSLLKINKLMLMILNIPVVAGAALQTPPSFIHWLIERSFSSKSSQYHKSQTLRARDPIFFKTMLTTCHMLCARCHVSRVTCHVSCVDFFFTNLLG